MAMCKHLLVLFLAFSVPGLTDGYDLTILHTGTFTSSYQQFTVTGDKCTDDQAAQGNCMGGVARLGILIKNIRNEEDNVLLLDGGDQLLGQWFSFYKGDATAHFMNALDFDATAIGNREFALGPDGLASFLQKVQFNGVCSNLDVSEEQVLDGLFSSSIKKTVGDEQIGIVGYTSERLNDIANVRNAMITDAIESVRREVELLTSQGIDKIIVLGHTYGGISDENEAMAIAENVPDVDIVVLGGANIFLCNDCPESDEDLRAYDYKAKGPYPMVITANHDPDGKVLLVNGYNFDRYLGRLNVKFEDGKLVQWSGDAMRLENYIKQDQTLLGDINDFAERFKNAGNRLLGTTLVDLQGGPNWDQEPCRRGECNMGNLVADAMLWEFRKYLAIPQWSDVQLAVINTGGVRTSIGKGDIRVRDVFQVLPFHNTFDAVKIQGKYIKKMLEHSAEGSDYYSGGFLQVAVNSRVVDVMVKCIGDCTREYKPLDEARMYKMALSSFIRNGGDGYDMLQNAVEYKIGDPGDEILARYIQQRSPILTSLQGRILLIPDRGDVFELTILHTGTFTSSYQQFTVTGDECTDDQAAQGNCMGGVARLGTLIKNIRNEEDNVLLLDGGDQLLGQWFSFYEGSATAHFMNALDFDAMAIGNLEFALGPSGLADFLKEIKFSGICSNLDVSEERVLEGLFSNSIVKTIGDEQIGIVGYTSERLNDIANVRNAKIMDPIESVRREVELLTSQGIDKIIVLGHTYGWISNENEAMAIAENVPDVDIVVLGGANIFLCDDCSDLQEDLRAYDYKAKGPYQMVITPNHDPNGKVLLVNGYNFARFLGRLNVNFINGKLVQWSGDPIRLDTSIRQDLTLLGDVNDFEERFKNAGNSLLGTTLLDLQGGPNWDQEPCRRGECNMENLVADALLWAFREYLGYPEWSGVQLAVMNAAGIRASIPKGDIRARDVHDILPFGNTFDAVRIQGKYIKQMLEHSAGAYDRYSGGFLQVSDPTLLGDINEYSERFMNAGNRLLDTTLVDLQGGPNWDQEPCRRGECNMGNLVADALLWAFRKYLDIPQWSGVQLAVMNAGGIRASIPKGDIRARDVHDILPFGNTFDAVRIPGKYIKQMLEHSAGAYDRYSGGFLQVSGLRVTYDMSRSVGNRVVEVLIQCIDCTSDAYEPLDQRHMYKMALSSFIRNGGDGYDMLQNAVDCKIGDSGDEILAVYIQETSPISVGLQGRIRLGPDQAKHSIKLISLYVVIGIIFAMVHCAVIFLIYRKMGGMRVYKKIGQLKLSQFAN